MRCDCKSVAILPVDKFQCILVGSVSKVVHCEVQVEGVVDWAKELFTVRWYEFEVVKIIELIKKCRCGQRRFIIIDEPASAVWIEGIRDRIEQSLKSNEY